MGNGSQFCDCGGNSLLLGRYIPKYAKKPGEQIYSEEELEQVYRVTSTSSAML
jgi:hypothetical protein